MGIITAYRFGRLLGKHYFFVFVLFLFSGCSEKESSLFVTKLPQQTGVNFQNKITSSLELNILNYIYYYNGAGVATADFNNDGLLDLYFTANEVSDELYLNKGNLQFEKITAAAGIQNTEKWTNGVSLVDINNDGWMDIYICKTGDYLSIKGSNLLFINQGLNQNGIPTFKEEAAIYGLDFVGFSTQAAFFDYDLDGDLDMYLLNHSVNPNQNYGKGSIRKLPNVPSGDKLFENQKGHFINVSSEAGIFESKIGYGLGVSVGDMNNDGYPDLYITNDFFENDYLYINQKNKTFQEVIHSKTPSIAHTTHYSMGNDIADLNNDGFSDIVSVDMLPEDLQTYKTSGTEFNYQNYLNYIHNGYAYQFMQNAIQFNNGHGSFSETGYASGIAATEWSWCPLLADFDLDGYNDVYITNGILGATNDMDFINFIANDNIQKSLGKNMTEKEMDFIQKIPDKKTTNYFFKNRKNNQFENVTEAWTSKTPSFSNGASYADLDNDGDLDLIVNNVNEPAFILENTQNESPSKRNYLKITFKGGPQNNFGIGAKVIVYAKDLLLTKENYTTRGYLSSTAPQLIFGLDTLETIDSLKVIWPNKSFQTIKTLAVNHSLTLHESNASGNFYDTQNTVSPLRYFSKQEPLFLSRHEENSNIEFNRDPLTPFSMCNEGPGMAVVDINNDGLEDVFMCGAKGQASQLYVQLKSGKFSSRQNELFEEDALNEDVAQVFFDANGDGYKDLLIVSGGNEFINGKVLEPRFYWNEKGVLKKDTLQFKNCIINASSVSIVDLNNDSFLDVCITANTVPQKFGYTPQQYLFKNDGQGHFTDVTLSIGNEFSTLGNCNDLVWIDLTNDGLLDAIAVGDWMPISIFVNNGKTLTLQKNNGLEKTHGFWNTIKAADFDQDGDIDLVAGNWGLNSRFTATEKEPITLYKNDFDGNGNEETLVTYFYKGIETPLASKEELVKQMPYLNKKYLSFHDFAKASVKELFSDEKLQQALQRKTYELASCYFENLGNNTFKKHPLPFGAQLSSINDFWVEDLNEDGYPDLLLVGNNFEISTQLGRLDALHGLILINDGKGNFTEKKDEDLGIWGAARHIEELSYKGEKYLIITQNNNTPIFLKKTN